ATAGPCGSTHRADSKADARAAARQWDISAASTGPSQGTSMLPGPAGLLVFRDQLAKHQRQDSAVVHVLDLGLVVDTRPRGERRRVSVIVRCPHLDLLT